MKKTAKKVLKRMQRHQRIRSRVFGTPEKPRLAFFRSNKHVYAQIIDDTVGKTMVGVSSLKDGGANAATKKAEQMGTDIAKQATEKKIKKVVFDRGGFAYTGSVKVFADAARKSGLEF